MRFKSLHDMRKDARAIFNAGLTAVAPASAIMAHCHRDGDRFQVGSRTYDLSRYQKIWIIGTGKAAAAMAKTLENLLGNRIHGGLVTVKYGHLATLQTVRIVEAGHPVPDENGCDGARRIMAIARSADARDLVICLISGGGSALMPLPGKGLTLADKQAANQVLLACGASIHETNTIRKHLSAIKGGRLAAAIYPAESCTLILSDVVGDDLDIIASGPTVPDTGTFKDALAIVDRYRIAKKLPNSVIRYLEAGAAEDIAESPKPENDCFKHAHHVIVASNRQCVQAARKEALTRGYHTLILSTLMEGETRHVARVHGAMAREILTSGHPVPSPACLISGGETTVTLKGNGRGGRNQEFVLAAAIDIEGAREAVILSGGTDGTDGPTDAAGAIADGHTVARASADGLDPRHHLETNDAYPLFERLDDLVVTGPTNTNVMDLRLVLASIR